MVTSVTIKVINMIKKNLLVLGMVSSLFVISSSRCIVPSEILDGLREIHYEISAVPGYPRHIVHYESEEQSMQRRVSGMIGDIEQCFARIKAFVISQDYGRFIESLNGSDYTGLKRGISGDYCQYISACMKLNRTYFTGLDLDGNGGTDSDVSGLKRLYNFLTGEHDNDFYRREAEWICNNMNVNALKEEYVIRAGRRPEPGFAILVSCLKMYTDSIKNLGYVMRFPRSVNQELIENLCAVETRLSTISLVINDRGGLDIISNNVQGDLLALLVNFYRQGKIDISFEAFRDMDFDVLLDQIRELCRNLAARRGFNLVL